MTYKELMDIAMETLVMINQVFKCSSEHSEQRISTSGDCGGYNHMRAGKKENFLCLLRG